MKCMFIYNPESGNGRIRKKEEYIVKSLSEKYQVVDVKRTEYQGHAKEYALDSVGKYDTLIVAGGDGTLNEVVSAIAQKDGAPTIGYIPTGTVNDVAHSLGISKNIKKALYTILNGKPFSHDVFRVKDRYGLYVCAIGSISESSYLAKRKSKKAFGKLAYFFHGASKIFSGKSFYVKLEYDGGVIEQEAALFLAMNSKHVAGFTVNKEAELSDGLVDIVLIENQKEKVTLESLLKIAKLFLFKLKRSQKTKGLTYLQLDKFKFTTSPTTAVNLDGEFGFYGSFDFEVVKGGIKILI